MPIYTFDPVRNVARKEETDLKIPEVVVVSGRKYSLIGTVNHLGADATSGHYVAAVKTGKEWLAINDAMARAVGAADVLLGGGYALLYELSAA
jgi:ubiquitin C-terminal hydrolase